MKNFINLNNVLFTLNRTTHSIKTLLCVVRTVVKHYCVWYDLARIRRYLTKIGFMSFWVNFKIKAYHFTLLYLELNSFVKIKIFHAMLVLIVELLLSIKSTLIENEFNISSRYLTSRTRTFILSTVKRRYSSILKCLYSSLNTNISWVTSISFLTS